MNKPKQTTLKSCSYREQSLITGFEPMFSNRKKKLQSHLLYETILYSTYGMLGDGKAIVWDKKISLCSINYICDNVGRLVRKFWN